MKYQQSYLGVQAKCLSFSQCLADQCYYPAPNLHRKLFVTFLCRKWQFWGPQCIWGKLLWVGSTPVSSLWEQVLRSTFSCFKDLMQYVSWALNSCSLSASRRMSVRNRSAQTIIFRSQNCFPRPSQRHDITWQAWSSQKSILYPHCSQFVPDLKQCKEICLTLSRDSPEVHSFGYFWTRKMAKSSLRILMLQQSRVVMYITVLVVLKCSTNFCFMQIPSGNADFEDVGSGCGCQIGGWSIWPG